VIHSLLEIDVDVGSPELLVNRLSRNELTRMRHEDPQQLEGLWSEPDRALGFPELKAGGVELERAETEKPVVTQAGSSLRAERTFMLPRRSASACRRALDTPSGT
jgi:hypothetical protein